LNVRLCANESIIESEDKVIETRQILEELQLRTVLATSPTGAVFLAGDPATGSEVVVKMVSCAVPNAEEDIRRLFLEMAVAARSGQIKTMPALTDHGLTPEGDGFLVMAPVDGRTLDTIDQLSTFATVNILLDVLSCIEDLAAAGTAHLNLTPDNVFVVNPPAYDRAVILGFGTSATLLHAGAGVPVPAHDPHLAPELVSGDLLPPDQAWRSDLFSFGVIACGALGAEIEADGYGRPRVTFPAAVRSSMPEAAPLEAVLGKVMEPDPAKRGESPSDARDPLIRALPDPPAIGAAKGLSDEPSGASEYDLNKTDPVFEAPPAVAASNVETRAESLTAEMRPKETISTVIDDGEAWPEVLFDDPELPASLDEPEDTDVRNPIPGDVWVPDGDGPGGSEPVPTAVPPGARRAASVRRVSPVELAIVAAVVVVLGSIIAFTWPGQRPEEPPPVTAVVQFEGPEPADALVPPPPDDNLFDDLLAIQRLVDDGELEEAKSDLRELEDRDGLSFSSDEAALYDSLVEAVSLAVGRDAAINDLRSGLGQGSIRMIRRGTSGLGGLSADEVAEVTGLADDLTRARRALRLHGDMWQAHRGGDHLSAIELSWRMEDLLPAYSGAAGVRDQSAAALESRAEALIAGSDFESAVAVLESLQRTWPDRQGARDRIEWCRNRIDLTRRGESVIAVALAKGDSGEPESGLVLLDGMDPDPGLRDEVDRARSVLQTRLDEMDAGEPVIEMAADVELAFKKNQTLVVPLMVIDDYRVERVVVHARNETDDGYLQIPLKSDGGGLYSFTVAPELHGNKTVYFYVVARDHSGHVGRYGSHDEPHVVVRKKWFKKLR
jgi:serine/threonine protein kinase